jgi:hypothetical protein
MLKILFIPDRFLRKIVHNRQLMKITLLKFLFVLFVIYVFTGCKKHTVINERQAILFQVDYVNYAFGYQHNGFIIDNEGRVLTYKNPQEWIFPDKDFKLSGNQVHENIEKCRFSGKIIPSEELIRYARYIKNISSSKVTAPKNVAADAGSLEYICYQFWETSDTYKGCIIKMEGDFTCENLNFYSKKVSTWLKNINETLNKR